MVLRVEPNPGAGAAVKRRQPDSRQRRLQPANQSAVRSARSAQVGGRVGHRGQLFSGLTSLVAHLLILMVLGALYVPVNDIRGIEIVLAMSNSQTAEFELETLDVVATTNQHLRTDAFHGAPAASSTVPVVLEVKLASLESNVLSQESGADDWRSDSAEASNQTKVQSPRTYKTDFFGISAPGRRFVYLLDMSTSMRERNGYGQTRFQVAAKELLRSVQQLDEKQEFLVVAFCYQTHLFTSTPSRPALVAATQANKARLRVWLDSIHLASGTDPRTGVVAGLRLNPDAIFLLSDGEFNGRKKNRQRILGNPTVEQLIAVHRRRETPIHTVAFEADTSRTRLAAIAMATKGKHRFFSR